MRKETFPPEVAGISEMSSMADDGIGRNELRLWTGVRDDFEQAFAQGKSMMVVVRENYGSRTREARLLHNFLRSVSGERVVVNARELTESMDATKISIEIGFVDLTPDLNTDEMLDRGIVLVDEVIGDTLQDKQENIPMLDMSIPKSVHYAILFGWLEMMSKLEKRNIVVDQNIDTDLIILPIPERGVYETIMIDPRPIYLEDDELRMGITKSPRYIAAVKGLLVVLEELYGRGSADGEDLFNNANYFAELRGKYEVQMKERVDKPWSWADIKNRMKNDLLRERYMEKFLISDVKKLAKAFDNTTR